MRDFADELIHLAGNLDGGTTSASQAYDDLHAIAKDLQSEKNWADEYFRKWQSAQQGVHLTALRMWLAVSISINVGLLIVLALEISGR